MHTVLVGEILQLAALCLLCVISSELQSSPHLENEELVSATQVSLSLYELAEASTPTLAVQRLDSTPATHLGVAFVAATLQSRQASRCTCLCL